jgi:uncharacterized protein (TIGR00251 family)
VILELYVQPGASRTGFDGKHGDRLKVKLRERAVDGAANEALVQFLSEHYGVPKRRVRIAAGLKSRLKRVEIDA